MAEKTKKRRKVKMTPKKTPRTRKPDNMSLEEWQIALRREYGLGQDFTVRNLGVEPFFSDFAVRNPTSNREYRVAIRGQELGVNYCSCPDFGVNTLGTCKHIEWLLGKLARRRGGKKTLAEGFHPPHSAVYLHYGIRRSVRFRRGSECPDALEKEVRRYFDEEDFLREEAVAVFDRFVRRAAKFQGHEVRIYDDVLAFVARWRDDLARRDAIDKRFGNGGSSAALNKLVKVKLYPYQRQGALFAAKAGRCLIADDMGLGKTIQAIAACEILAQTSGAERVLVICPTALKHQWKQEIEKFVDRSSIVVEGLKPMRQECYKEETFFKVTNYETVHRDMDLIAEWHPDIVILDEAQRIKNWKTRRAKAVKQVESSHAIVLTGTPIENRLEELHSIMEFVDLFHLGPLFRFLDEHQHTDEVGRVIGYRNLDKIKESLSAILIRRRKQEVLRELPERTDKHFFVDMTKPQREIHESNRDTVAQIVAKWRRWGFLSDQDQRRLMVALQYMRMACNSTYLIDKETDHSAKMDECCILLDEILEVPENKIVIFSQWLGTHELLIRRLDAEKRSHAFYHGSLNHKARKEVLERFKSMPECRILLCTDSGGVGLNLQHASVLINMDQPWNPAVLEQRIGRIHRLGQHRNVQVYHFVSRGTIEHGMLDVLKFKSSVFEGVLDGGESEVFLGASKMKKFMETVENVSSNIPEKAPAQEEDSQTADESGEVETASVSQPSPQELAWNSLLAAGVDFLGKLGEVSQAQASQKSAGLSLGDQLIGRNEKTGAPEVRIPLPDADTAQKLGDLLAGLGHLLKSIGGEKGK